jgi:EAL domain-containing protein (putative c-di-GMP-specific phosphodiesterase class I)
VALAIDDFGTGYSSLAYLQRLPVEVLKIDKVFVDRLTEGDRHAALIDGILGLGRNLSLVAVAEGIETEQQLHVLRALGCDGGQGYHFSRPLDAVHLRAYLQVPPAVGGGLNGAAVLTTSATVDQPVP